MEASHRSIHPNIAGVPWYAALLLAVTATAIGYGIDAGHKELTHVFAGFYIAGCVAAVVAVRQDGLFTAIIQPPLILFCAVPGAYWLFHDAKVGHLKDLLINCGYPLIERFPLMLGTAGIVLLIGLGRWYFGMSARPAAESHGSDDAEPAKSVLGGLAAKLQAILRPEAGEDGEDEATPAKARRSRGAGSPARERRTARGDRSAARSARAHSRRTREPLDDSGEPGERRSRRGSAAARDYDAAEPPRRSRRRPRPEADADPRGQSAREGRREPRTRRNPYESPYERPAPRTSRFDGADRYGDPFDPPGEQFGRFDSYDRYEPAYEPRRRRPAPNGNGGTTHHPISQVRYRGAADEPAAERRPERRNRSRAYGRPQRPPMESWEYDG